MRYVMYKGALYKQAYIFSPDAENYLYHVTEYANLENIAKEGLRRGRSHYEDLFLTTVGGVPYWINYVDAEAPHRVPGFDEKLQEWVEAEDDEDEEEHDARNPYNAPEIQPVVLRTHLLDGLKVDESGTRDSMRSMLIYLQHGLSEERKRGLPGHRPPPDTMKSNELYFQWHNEKEKLEKQLKEKAKAWKSSHDVDVKSLEVWTGTAWVPLSQWRQVKVPYNISHLLDTLTVDIELDPITLKSTK